MLNIISKSHNNHHILDSTYFNHSIINQKANMLTKTYHAWNNRTWLKDGICCVSQSNIDTGKFVIVTTIQHSQVIYNVE